MPESVGVTDSRASDRAHFRRTQCGFRHYGALIAIMHFAGSGAMRTRPEEDFETGFFVEKEYFLRTKHLFRPPLDPLPDPARKVSTRKSSAYSYDP